MSDSEQSMERNPYSPPQAHVDDLPPASHGLKRRSVLVMIVFIIITFGVYYLVWWFRRRPGLNRLNSPRKLALWPLLMVLTLWVIQFALAFVRELNPGEPVIGGTGGELFVTLFQLAVGIVMIVQAFKVKDMIEDHAAPEEQSGPGFAEHVKLSGLMTFFFSIFYLQWAINRYVVGKPS
jgi:heme/copper-type cytochrome/quinol oxidase subunit 2